MIRKPTRLGDTFGVSVPNPPPTSSCRDPLRTFKVNSSRSAFSGCNPTQELRTDCPTTSNLNTNAISVSPAYQALPSFGDVPRSEKHALFIMKLKQCCVVFDFVDPKKRAKEKKIKQVTLKELVDYVTTVTRKFTEDEIEEIIRMASMNLFRVLNPTPKKTKNFSSSNSEEEEPFMDPSWPHLEKVYDFLLKFLESRELDTRMAMKYVDSSFILRLLDLFNSEDPRERESVKAILHRIYSKFTKHRSFIKKAIENILYQFIYESEEHNGIAELLEILASVIAGFITPLKEEHKLFLIKVLIPLHKTSSIKMYHQQLCYCIMQFIDKDSRLAGTAIRGLLKYWPITNSSKEVMFLEELEEILEATSSIEFDSCMIPLSRQISRCLNKSHSQIAEKALALWKNYRIERLMEQNMGTVLPILYPSLDENSTWHWNKAIQKLTQNVIQIFSNHNAKLFKECAQLASEEKVKQEMARTRYEETWKRLEEIASANTMSNHHHVTLASQHVY